jgi:hypothetical protein
MITAVMLTWSNITKTFVIYGRTARELVPFFALLSGWAIARFESGSWHNGWVRPIAISVTVMIAAINFAYPLAQVFPLEFRQQGDAMIDTRLNEISDPADRELRKTKFKFLYVRWNGASTFYTTTQNDDIRPRPIQYKLPPYQVLLHASHPLQYEPYLFEGFNEQQRDAIRATDISMRLILLKD